MSIPARPAFAATLLLSILAISSLFKREDKCMMVEGIQEMEKNNPGKQNNTKTQKPDLVL